jgi:hypothetical protein
MRFLGNWIERDFRFPEFSIQRNQNIDTINVEFFIEKIWEKLKWRPKKFSFSHCVLFVWEQEWREKKFFPDFPESQPGWKWLESDFQFYRLSIFLIFSWPHPLCAITGKTSGQKLNFFCINIFFSAIAKNPLCGPFNPQILRYFNRIKIHFPLYHSIWFTFFFI